jgi:hypothetical protein
VWRGTPFSPAVANSLSVNEVRVYALIAWHAATRTRISFVALGRVRGEQGTELGWVEARRVVNDLHDRGLLLVTGWKDAARDTPLAFYLSHMPPPTRVPRYLRDGEGRVAVGGRFTAPATLDPDLLAELQATGELLKRHQQVPGDQRDGKWIANLATYTEARAAAFHQWASVDAAQVIKTQADRLTLAAQDIRVQAANRLATEEAKARK